MSLTDKEKKEYLENPNLCPKCKSDNIETHSNVHADDDYLWRYVECDSCGFFWKDLYQLLDIKEEEK